MLLNIGKKINSPTWLNMLNTICNKYMYTLDDIIDDLYKYKDKIIDNVMKRETGCNILCNNNDKECNCIITDKETRDKYFEDIINFFKKEYNNNPFSESILDQIIKSREGEIPNWEKICTWAYRQN